MLKLDAKTKRFLLWAILVFVVAVIAMIIVALVKKSKPTTGNTQTATPTGPLTGPVVVLPSTATPPIAPANPANPASPANPTQPTQLPGQALEVNWTYITDLTWKLFDVVTKGDGANPGLAAYRCEITNGIIEMGERDMSAFSQLYRQWYNRSLREDYCAKVTSSGCWTALWDKKPATACKRLKTYA